MQSKPVICLTFDLEEFDLPLEFKQQMTPGDQFAVTQQGMEALLPELAKVGAHCTFFTTANFAEHQPSLIKQVSLDHEIASHSYFHSAFETNHLLSSRQKLEEIAGKPVTGFRMPRMLHVDHAELVKAGYKYDSSLNPTWIPGRYNHFSKTKTIHTQNGLVLFPASVTPGYRTPLFWLSFKNFSIDKYCRLVQRCLSTYGYANIYLHPWEFADLSKYKLPRYIQKDKKEMIEKLSGLLARFEGKARFITIQQFLHERHDL